MQKSFFKKVSLLVMLAISVVNVVAMDPNSGSGKQTIKQSVEEADPLHDLPPLGNDSDLEAAPIPTGRTYAVLLTLREARPGWPHGNYYWNVYNKVVQKGSSVYEHLPFAEGEKREMSEEAFRSILQKYEASQEGDSPLEAFCRVQTPYYDYVPLYEYITGNGNRYWVAVAKSSKRVISSREPKDLLGIPVQSLKEGMDRWPGLGSFSTNMRDTLRYGVFPGCQEIFRNPDFPYGPGPGYVANDRWGYDKISDGAK